MIATCAKEPTNAMENAPQRQELPSAREDWFPTSVWMFDHPDAQTLNTTLLRCIHAVRRADSHGITDRSSVRGWHSRDDLHRRSGMDALLEFIAASITQVTTALSWDRTQVAPRITNCWANINGPGASNQTHNHPNSYLSGAYYVQAPPQCGDIFFDDPRAPAVMQTVPLTRYSPLTYARVTYPPQVGRLLIFPSWLSHGVGPNESQHERVSISFNVGVRWLDAETEN